MNSCLSITLSLAKWASLVSWIACFKLKFSAILLSSSSSIELITSLNTSGMQMNVKRKREALSSPAENVTREMLLNYSSFCLFFHTWMLDAPTHLHTLLEDSRPLPLFSYRQTPNNISTKYWNTFLSVVFKGIWGKPVSFYSAMDFQWLCECRCDFTLWLPASKEANV